MTKKKKPHKKQQKDNDSHTNRDSFKIGHVYQGPDEEEKNEISKAYLNYLLSP